MGQLLMAEREEADVYAAGAGAFFGPDPKIPKNAFQSASSIDSFCVECLLVMMIPSPIIALNYEKLHPKYSAVNV